MHLTCNDYRFPLSHRCCLFFISNIIKPFLYLLSVDHNMNINGNASIFMFKLQDFIFSSSIFLVIIEKTNHIMMDSVMFYFMLRFLMTINFCFVLFRVPALRPLL